MTRQYTKEERIAKLTQRVNTEFSHSRGALKYALEYVDKLAGLRKEYPRGAGIFGIDWLMGRPHWLDHSMDERIDIWHSELLNVGREEHDFSLDNPECDKDSYLSRNLGVDKLCTKCGESKGTHNAVGNKRKCRGYPSNDW